ncbi:MAG: HD domain-containing protein [Nitrospirae bacterium]|nr:HD domain-containing protein [Nitrospirota bacterium]
MSGEIVKTQTEITKEIKKYIRILNGLLVLVVYCMLFLIVKYLYEVLEYVPITSTIAIIVIASFFIVLSIFLSNRASNRAIKKIEEYSSKLDTLLTVTRDIKGEKYSDILLDKIMDSSLAMTGADAGSVLLIEDEALIFKIVKGKESKNLVGTTMPNDKGIAGWVVSTGQSVRIEDASADRRFDSSVDAITIYQTRSLMCVPMRLSSGIVGVIELINKRQGDFTEEDETVISYFADQAAIAIDRAMFFEGQKNYEIHITDMLLDSIDNYILQKRGHSRRIAKYSFLIARAMNMTDEDKNKLYRASLMHDIGFLKIKLDEPQPKEEYRKHVVLGYELLKKITFYKDVAHIVLHHHERYDGEGYPRRIKRKEIPLESRIIAIAEAFDAMTSKNSYKSPVGFSAAIDELKQNAGTQFDPELTDLFIKNADQSILET